MFHIDYLPYFHIGFYSIYFCRQNFPKVYILFYLYSICKMLSGYDKLPLLKKIILCRFTRILQYFRQKKTGRAFYSL